MNRFFFGSPWPLLGLIPWAAIVVYVLAGRRKTIPVPFVDLWRDLPSSPARRPAWRLPPMAVIATLLSALLAIISCADPQTRGGSRASRPAFAIVDRGITMSARADNSKLRFQDLAVSSAPDVLRLLGAGPMSIYVVPTGQEMQADRADWADRIAALDPTAADTQGGLIATARRALANPDAIVLLFSDRKIGLADERLIQIAPKQILADVAISDLQVRQSPFRQAMVKLLNDSPARQADLRISGLPAPIHVTLPPKGATRTYFVDLLASPQVIEATIDPGAGAVANNHAWTIRAANWPVVRLKCAVPAELQRILDAYRRNRPAGAGSNVVNVVSLSDVVPAQPSVAVVSETTSTSPISRSKIESESNAITDGIDWSAVASDAQIAAPQPSADWRKIVWTRDQTLVAIRAEPCRQVWVGFRSAAWAATPDFVIFWANVFDWLGNAGDRYESKTIGPMDTRLPGIYTEHGQTFALNAPAVDLDPAEPMDWQTRLSQLAAERGVSSRDLRPLAIIAAITCLLVAAAFPPLPVIRERAGVRA